MSVIQSIEAGVAKKPLYLNPSGGDIVLQNSSSDTLTINSTVNLESPVTVRGLTDIQDRLTLTSTSDFFTLNRVTTAQRNAGIALNGMLVYNTDTNALNFYNGAWQAL